jgi:uncharacterized membrane protein YqjE
MNQTNYMEDERRLSPPEPSAVGAVERGVEAAQRIVVEGLELLRLEAEERLSRTVRGAALLSLGGALTFIGWCALMLVVVLILRERWSLIAGLAAVGVGHLVVGAGAIAYAMADTGKRRQQT